MKRTIWRVVTMALLIVSACLFIQAWLAEATQQESRMWCFLALGGLIACVVGYPFAVREDGETYLGILRKYFF